MANMSDVKDAQLKRNNEHIKGILKYNVIDELISFSYQLRGTWKLNWVPFFVAEVGEG